MNELLKRVIDLEKITELNQIQLTALKKGIEKNLVVSAPTASGKTLVAVIATLTRLRKGGKVVFSFPLKALALEQFESFKKYSKEFNFKSILSIGDFDSNKISQFDVLFTTYEKLFSLINHNSFFLKKLSLLVIDEIHEIDSSRGPTIEIILTILRSLNPSLQVIGLSATIPNAIELAKWLDAELIESNERPIKLFEGSFFQNTINYSDNSQEFIKSFGTPLASLVKNTLTKNKQALIFCNTRKKTIATALKLKSIVKEFSKNEKTLKKVSKIVLNALDSPTEQCKQLSESVSHGVAFHNAGLTFKQKKVIEDAFRKGSLKIICCTSTLSAGINVPAFTVIITSVYRFTGFSSEKITVREFKQLSGRAGRPKYDSFGRAITVVSSEEEREFIQEKFINGNLEEINSRLGIEPVLRFHLLALIANNLVFDFHSLENFLSKTFFAFQFNNSDLFEKINELLLELKDYGFIEFDGKKFKATLVGKRIIELYLDPVSAFNLINYLKKQELNEMHYLMMISSCNELLPLEKPKKTKQNALLSEFYSLNNSSFNSFELMYSDLHYLEKFNLSKAISFWINECTDQEIFEEFNLSPGIFHSKLKLFDWLLYSSIELSKLLGINLHLSKLTILRIRIKYGVKDELIPLVQLKGIGRIRARKLFKAGIKSVKEIKNNPKKIISLFGEKTAKMILKQI